MKTHVRRLRAETGVLRCIVVVTVIAGCVQIGFESKCASHLTRPYRAFVPFRGIFICHRHSGILRRHSARHSVWLFSQASVRKRTVEGRKLCRRHAAKSSSSGQTTTRVTAELMEGHFTNPPLRRDVGSVSITPDTDYRGKTVSEAKRYVGASITS